MKPAREPTGRKLSDEEREARRAKQEGSMPLKNWEHVTTNTNRAIHAIGELRAKTKDRADRERLRQIELAIYDLDELQSQLHAIMFGLAKEGRFRTVLGEGLQMEAEQRKEAIAAARARMEAASKGGA